MAADIRIYGWRKPTLTLTLVEGGTLVADTKYYIVGVFGFTPFTYNTVSGAESDVYEITTTSTHRSVQILQETFRDITAFSDNGDGKTLVACHRHCFTDGDTVKIDSGSYSGSWSVEWVDYHSFLINTAYVDNVAVECYSDSHQYNYPSLASGYGFYRCMMYYISPLHPYPDGVWTRAYVWNKRPWHTSVIQNPHTITAPQTERYSIYSGHPYLSESLNSDQDYMKEFGSIYVEWRSGIGTIGDIYTAVQASGFYNNCEAATTGYTNTMTFKLFGTVRGYSDSYFLIARANVTIYGEFRNEDPDRFIFNDCMINFAVSFFSGYLYFTANNSSVFNGSTANSYIGWIKGSNTLVQTVPRSGNDYGEDWTDLLSGDTVRVNIVDDKIFQFDSTGYYQASYNDFAFRNVKSVPFYWITSPAPYIPSKYMMENVEIKECGSNRWHIRIYSYVPQTYFHIKLLNVDGFDEDGVQRDQIRFTHNSVIKQKWDIFRRLEIYVQTDGVFLEGASISIVDDALNTYSGTTDVDGFLEVDVLEQVTEFDGTEGTISAWDGLNDTMFSDFEITVSKTGYQTETIHIEKAADSPLLNINILPEAEPVYIDRNITGEISTVDITGEVELTQEITGTITVEEISGEVEVTQNITGVIESEEISGEVS